ncbi:hypothetical protein JOL79_07015 [Microbispora sp. RL4-1S]|uniref:Uncharacterized protein n=1 Tax=Microbispora oryzae TaxID=2806554 RepID=A0A940WDH7_9ACTN|nr:hypothetical protein [Microbispora oryzae]MBP2703549.1 hypothetical protein [Microbispora oryzae]
MTTDRTSNAPAESAGAAPSPSMADVWSAEHAAELAGFDLDPAERAEIEAIMSSLATSGEAEQAAAEADLAADAAEQAEPARVGDEQPPAPEVGQADEAPAPEPEAADEQPERPAPDVKVVKAAAEEIGMLDALHKWIGDELKAKRAAAAELFADAANLGGQRQVELVLPDGTRVGSWNIAQPEVVITWNEAAVLDYTRRHAPHNVYDVVNSAALNYPDVVEYIRLTHPELVRDAVRPAYLDLLAEELDAQGQLPDKTTGELVTVAERVKVAAIGDGKIAWTRPKRNDPTSGRDKLVAAWRAGELAGRIALDPPPVAE